MIVRCPPLSLFLLFGLASTSSAAWWNPFSKNGFLTKMTEALPFGGFITAPIHAAAGNPTNALQAAVAGFQTTAALAIGGPPSAAMAGLAVGTAGIRSIIQDHGDRITAKPAAVAGAVIARTGAAGVARAFDQGGLEGKDEAVRAVNRGDSEAAGFAMLRAIEKHVREQTRLLSGEAGGRKKVKSAAHGSYLRAVEPEWRVDMVWREAKEWEQWFIEDWGGKVVFKGRGGPNKPGQFLRAYPSGAVDLTGSAPQPWEQWKAFKNEDGTWSFMSVHGTWLSARQDGSVTTVVRCDAWERFWLETW